jgi:LCP family protein required for cell wall assembly
MFEHLDDPAPYRPAPGLRDAVAHRGRRLRRRRRLATGLAGALMVAGLAGGGGALYVQRRDAAIDRIDVTTDPSVGSATNVLVVGTDDRPGLDGVRADTIVLVRVRADGGVDVLSVPRDLRLPPASDAGSGGSGDGPRRLGSARDRGPQAMIDAVRGLTGVPVDHYVELDMPGFVDLVDDLGGLRLAVDAPLRDRSAGLDLAPDACATLDGEQALALVRSRHLEVGRDGGRFEIDPTSDLGRATRAQAVATAAVAALAEADDPATLDRVSRTLAEHASLDEGLDLPRLAQLARAVAVAGPGALRTATLPVVDAGDGATLELAPGAQLVLAAFGAEPDRPSSPATTAPPPAGSAAQPTGEAPVRPCD